MEKLKKSANGQWKLEKADPDFRIPKKINFDRPFVDITKGKTVHGDYHGFGGEMNEANSSQKELIHGIKLEDSKPLDESQKGISKGVSTVVNQINGKKMILKPASGAEGGDQKAQKKLGQDHVEGMNSARREVIHHNLAHALGIGKYFPTTAGFTMMGEDFSAMEWKDGPAVGEVLKTLGTDTPHEKSKHLSETIVKMEETGDLHKLAILDALMANHDRHFFNLVLDNEQKVLHHIDNGRSLDYENATPFTYSSLLNTKSFFDRKSSNRRKLHPAAEKWLTDLDKQKAESLLDKYLSKDSQFKTGFISRLQAMQEMLRQSKTGKKGRKLSVTQLLDASRIKPEQITPDTLSNVLAPTKKLA